MTDRVDRISPSGSAVVDGLGTAIVSLSPGRPFVTWEVERYAVLIPGETLSPVCTVYRNTVGPGAAIESTRTGQNDASDQPNVLPLTSSETLVFVWTGATPGLTATATITGRQVVQQ